MRRAARPDRPFLPATERFHALTAVAVDHLAEGRLEIVGRLTAASNATFLCRITGADGQGMNCVYKPIRGERPLDDFPHGTLAARERAAYILSEATGWSLVPPTVVRDGPLGSGMVQQWIEPDRRADVLEMVVRPDHRLRPICVYDVLANNADRKAGHLLPVASGKIFGVDHGICFSVEPKLRTVLWGWRGQPLNQAELGVVRQVADALDGTLGAELETILTPAEVLATAERARQLLATGRFPEPDPSRPALPWPPY